MQLPKRSCLSGFLIRERPESICAKLSLVGINGLLCLMVDGAHGIFPALGTAILGSRNRDIMLVPQLFHGLFQLVCRESAHFHPTTARNGTAEKVQVQLCSGSAGIFAVQLEEVSHLVKDQIIRVAFLDAVVVPHTYLMKNFIDGIPQELDEAATIDGCSYYGVFLRIILPLLVPALITGAIFSFMWRWDDFLSALLYITSTENYPVCLALKLFCDPSSSSDYGAMFAMSTLSILPAVLIFIFFQKYLVEGITTSGLKG